MNEVNPNTREKLGRQIMNLGCALPTITGGVLTLGGLVLFGYGFFSRSENMLVDPAGFAMAFGILALAPGILILVLTGLSRLGPRNRTLTLLGSFGIMGVGLYLENPSVFSSLSGPKYAIGLHLLALCFLLGGFSALIGWWLRGVIAPTWALASLVFVAVVGVVTLIQSKTSERGRQVLAGHTGSVLSIAWSPDGTHLLSTSLDDKVILWEVDNGTSLLTLDLSPDTLIAWSPQGKAVSLTVSDGLSIRDLETDEELLQLELDSEDAPLTDARWSPDGRRLLVSFEDALMLWDLEAGGKPRKVESEGLGGFQWSPGGDAVWLEYVIEFNAADSRSERMLKLQDMDSGAVLARIPVEDTPQSVALSPDSGLVVVVEDGFLQAETHAFVVDVRTGKQVPFKDVAGNTRVVAFSPDGSQIAGAENEVIDIWDARTGELLRRLEGHTQEILDLDWSPDGERLASGSADQNVIVWSLSP